MNFFFGNDPKFLVIVEFLSYFFLFQEEIIFSNSILDLTYLGTLFHKQWHCSNGNICCMSFDLQSNIHCGDQGNYNVELELHPQKASS